MEHNTMKFTCKECIYYLPIDVFKGLCKITKNNILPDAGECDKYQKMQKCKFCANFNISEKNNYMGKCMDKANAYPDMNARLCKDFTWE
jgi:hypothetical protein